MKSLFVGRPKNYAHYLDSYCKMNNIISMSDFKDFKSRILKKVFNEDLKQFKYFENYIVALGELVNH